MNKKFIRKALPFVALGVLITPTVAWASTTATVSGGSLLFNDGSTSSLSAGTTAAGSTQDSSITSFGAQTINMANGLPSSSGTEYMRVDDNTGTLNGWNVTVQASNLSATGITDPTVSGATLTVNIPVANLLTVTPSALSAVAGSTTGVNLGGASYTGSGSEPVSSTAGEVLNANAGYGGGAYTEKLAYNLSLPTTIPATDITSSSSSSKFTSSRTDNQSILAGNYSTTITYAINSAP